MACHFKAAHVELHTQTGVTSYVSVRFARKVVQIAPFHLTILFCMRNIFGGDNPEAVKFGKVSRSLASSRQDVYATPSRKDLVDVGREGCHPNFFLFIAYLNRSREAESPM